ncbi:MAG TPA: tail fiber domain-containing protein [Limnobacter sp.]|nr:tail fiber domain-containing protein [Limnobacter sp.]
MGGLVGKVFGGSKAPPPPDYTPVAQASKEVQQLANEQAQRALDESKRQFDINQQITDRVVDRQLSIMDETAEQARDYYDYGKSFRPLEQQMAAEAGDPTQAAADEAERRVIRDSAMAQSGILRDKATDWAQKNAKMGEQLSSMQQAQGAEIRGDVQAYSRTQADNLQALRDTEAAKAQEFAQRATAFDAGQAGRTAQAEQTALANAAELKGRAGDFEQQQRATASNLQDVTQANAQTLRDRTGRFEDEARSDIALATGGNAGIRSRFASDIDDEVNLAVADARAGQTQALGTAARTAARYGLTVPANLDTLTTGNALALARAANTTRNATTDKYRGLVSQGIGLKQNTFSTAQGALTQAMDRQEGGFKDQININKDTFVTGQGATTDAMGRQQAGQQQRIDNERTNFGVTTAALTDAANRDLNSRAAVLEGNQQIYNTGQASKMAAMGLQTQGVREGAGMARDSFVTENAALSDAFNRESTALNNQRNQRIQDRSLDWARKLDVTGMARGMPGASQGAYGVSVGAGNAASSNQMQPGQLYMNQMNQANQNQLQGRQLAMSGLTNILSNQNTGFLTGRQQNLDMMGALVGGGAAVFAPSDKDVKKNIKKVGKDEATDLTRYEFEYKGDDSGARFEGVMAQDVEKKYPQAVITRRDGVKAVNYAQLGLSMRRVA